MVKPGAPTIEEEDDSPLEPVIKLDQRIREKERAISHLMIGTLWEDRQTDKASN